MNPHLPVSAGDPVIYTETKAGIKRELYAVVIARQVRFVRLKVFDYETGKFEIRSARPANLNRPNVFEREAIIELFELE